MQDKTHYIAITGIIKNNEGKYLICKRSSKEKVFPNKWCVPGGKLEQQDFVHLPKDIDAYWLDVLERTLRREIQEETSLLIKDIGYVSNLVFLRPNGYATVIISLYATLDKGIVKLHEEELTDFAWVSLEEAKSYDLLENLWEQMKKVEEMTKQQHQ